MFVDIAVNLTSSRFDQDRASVIHRAQQAGVMHQLVLASDLKETQEVIDLCHAYGGLFATAGVHPHQAKTWDHTSLERQRTFLNDPCVVAVGECGLDFNRNFSPPEQQKVAFLQQIELAQQLDMPVVMHERDAHQDFFEILTSVDIQGVLHCFTSDLTALKAYLDYGLSIGITGWICDERRGQLLQELVRYVPLDRLLVETDAPYLLPRDLPKKPSSRRNEPQYLPHIVETIARLRGDSLSSVAKACWHNFADLFPKAAMVEHI